LWGERRRWFCGRVLLPAAALGLLGLGIYAYLPLAARHQPPVNWGNPQTWHQFLWVVTGEQYQQFAFGLPSEAIPGRIFTWLGLFGDQFGWWGLAIALVGAWRWWNRDRWFILFCLVWLLPVGLYAFLYNTGDSHIYLLPVMMLMALWWGEGAGWLLRQADRLRPVWRRLALVAVVLLPVASLALHWRAVEPDDDWQADAYIQQVLEVVEPGGLIIVRGDRPTFTLWYGVYAEEKRPDVAIVNGPMLAYIWYRDHIRRLYPQITLNEPTEGDVTIDDLVHDLIVSNRSRPTYATDPKVEWEDGVTFVPVAGSPVYGVEVGES
jgi:hypothetical protein